MNATAAPTGESDATHASHCLFLWLPIQEGGDALVWCVILLFCLLPSWLFFTRSWLLPRRAGTLQQQQSAKESEVAVGVFLLALTWVVVVLHTQLPVLRHIHTHAHDVYTPIVLANLGMLVLSVPLACRLRNRTVTMELALLRGWHECNPDCTSSEIPTLVKLSGVRMRLLVAWSLALATWMINMPLKAHVLHSQSPTHSLALVVIVLDIWLGNIPILGWIMDAFVELRSSVESVLFVASLTGLSKRERDSAWAEMFEYWGSACLARILRSMWSENVAQGKHNRRDRQPLLPAKTATPDTLIAHV